MKVGDLACYLTHNFAPVLLLRRGKNNNWKDWDTWIVSLNGKEVEAWGENLVLWDNRKDEKVP